MHAGSNDAGQLTTGEMRYLPVELDVLGKEALVVGGTVDVVSKVERLLAAGARVTVLATGAVDQALSTYESANQLTIERRVPTEADLDGKAIVFIATSEDGSAGPLYERARREGRLLCTIDRPELSTFVNSAVVRVRGMTMTFATGGAAPGVVRRIREDLEALFDDERFGRLLEALGRLRARLPRGERAARLGEAVKGFAIEARLRFPAWLERGEEP
jgi:precorrin-2 dehydrogenase/sirohydrochlorin ferrochelatase